MSNLNVDSIKSSDGTKGPVITGNVVFSGSSHIVLPKGTTAQRPTGVAPGSLRFNTDTKLVEQYNGTDWVTLSSHAPGRGVFGGGYISTSPLQVNTIEYITISTIGNASYFGDLTVINSFFSACSSSTRGIFGAGYVATPVSRRNNIDYITIATTGNAIHFGDVTTSRSFLASCSSSTRGVFGGGHTPTKLNIIDYITIATTGNATDFGDLTQERAGLTACSSSIRGVFDGGATPTIVNTIDYITIATTGNATDFGDLTQSRYGAGSCSSSTRGVFGGGYLSVVAPASSQTNVIDYITIATTGNATDFGDLTQERTSPAGCSSSIRGVFGGGYGSFPLIPKYNIIDYITIATTGNATDFGDLTVTRGAAAACSDAHGGLS